MHHHITFAALFYGSKRLPAFTDCLGFLEHLLPVLRGNIHLHPGHQFGLDPALHHDLTAFGSLCLFDGYRTDGVIAEIDVIHIDMRILEGGQQEKTGASTIVVIRLGTRLRFMGGRVTYNNIRKRRLPHFAIAALLLYRLLYLQQFADLFHQLAFGNGHAHNLIVSFGRNEELLADDLDELTVVDFGDENMVVTVQDLFQVAGKGRR